MSTPWWRDAVGYEVYLRSFADGDGDGVGDLHGLRDRLGYLADLGVDIVWITPCYPSPGFDHGYDVADYLDVDEQFGGMAALEAVIADAHELGMRVIMDLVPNHSSHRHPWFQAALADPDAPERDYYVWREGRDGGQRPPNNWISHFGGPAWTRDPSSGQWYLHLFLPEQPDLNWRNPQVQAEFERILQTWFDRGIDGFRIDVAHSLTVDEEFRDNPIPDPPPDWSNPRAAFEQVEHLYDLDQTDNVEIYRAWAKLAAEHDTLLLGEVYLPTGQKVARYVEDGLLHRAFFFPSLHTDWDHGQIAATLQDGITAGQGRFAWVMSSHDDPRAATRFGGGQVGTRRQLAYLAMLLALPGTPFLYQGDELGLTDGQLPAGAAADPISTRNDGAPGRDGSRTPMPWRDGPALGFTTGTPWLSPGTNHGPADTAEAQRGDPTSPLERTRALLATRRTCTTMLDADDVVWLQREAPVLAIQRGDVVAAINVAGPAATVALPTDGDLIAASADGVHLDGTTLHLPPDTTAWVRVGP